MSITELGARSSRSRARKIIFALVALTAAACGGRSASDTASAIGQAVAQHNQSLFYASVDIDKLGSSLASEFGREAGVSLLGGSRRIALTEQAQRAIANYFEKRRAVASERTQIFGDTAEFAGLRNESVNGDVAVVEAVFSVGTGDDRQEAIVTMQFEKRGDGWVLVALPGLARVIQQGSERASRIARELLSGERDPETRVMARDLRNLSAAQEAYYADRLDYIGGSNITEAHPLRAGGKVVFAPSPGVTMDVLHRPASESASPGWSATARHQDDKAICVMFVNAYPPPPPARDEGEPACTAPTRK